jgi:hypothetical protein
LPSTDLEITEAGVFWPQTSDPLYSLVGDSASAPGNGLRASFATTPSSDHSLVWVSVKPVPEPSANLGIFSVVIMGLIGYLRDRRLQQNK